MRSSPLACLLSLALTALLPGAANALSISFAGGGADLALGEADLGCGPPDDKGAFRCAGGVWSGDGYELELGGDRGDLQLDPDPVVVLPFAVFNAFGVTQTYVVKVTLPIAAIVGPLTIQGSIDGSLTEAGGDGASVNDAGVPIYTALIDGTPVETLLDDPFGQSDAGPFTSVDVGPAGFGPLMLNQNATTSIAINLVFNLSPGDLASFTAVFTVEPKAIPEPASAILGGAGLLGLLAFGRSRAKARR